VKDAVRTRQFATQKPGSRNDQGIDIQGCRQAQGTSNGVDGIFGIVGQHDNRVPAVARQAADQTIHCIDAAGGEAGTIIDDQVRLT